MVARLTMVEVVMWRLAAEGGTIWMKMMRVVVSAVGEGVRGGDDDGGVVGDKVADDGGERVTREAAAGVMAGWR
ncbi:hypothetical protein Tco_1087815 [Tanacetum coccineum]